MKVELSPQAAKYLNRLNNPLKGRIIESLKQLAEEPPRGDSKSLTGRDGYRLRVGDMHILFDVAENAIVVHGIAPRGQAYKGAVKVSELRKEIQSYIDILPDSRLEALRPLLTLLVKDAPVIETNLTEEERAIIAKGREAYKTGGYVPLENR